MYINMHENADCVLNWTMIVLLALYSIDFVKVGLPLCVFMFIQPTMFKTSI